MYEKLRQKRKETNTTVKTLRGLINLKTDPSYFKKETGATTFTVEEAFVIADYFKTTVDKLFR